jgi:hypothetical protein
VRWRNFAEQARIFHRDDRLVGESANKLYLALGERVDPLAAESERANDYGVAQQGHAEQSAGDLLPRRERVVGVRRDIGDVYDFAL